VGAVQCVVLDLDMVVDGFIENVEGFIAVVVCYYEYCPHTKTGMRQEYKDDDNDGDSVE